MARPSLTACIITLNEERHIADCIRSVDFTDEVVVIDSHSTDRTREIAADLGARVIRRDWPGHVAQKNFAVDAATHDWVLCLDADERVTPELRARILDRLDRDALPDGFTVNRRNRYMGRWMRHGGWYPDPKLRLFRRDRGRWGGRDPHDRARVDGPVEALNADLLHDSYESLADHLRTIDSFTTIGAAEKHAAGEHAGIARLTVRPLFRFIRMYILQRGFLDGTPGFILAVMSTYYVFLKYAKLRELNRT